jgi:hypothetical protein
MASPGSHIAADIATQYMTLYQCADSPATGFNRTFAPPG